MYSLYGLRGWNTPERYVYNHCQHRVYLMRRRVDL
jgi:hypothetical protein